MNTVLLGNRGSVSVVISRCKVPGDKDREIEVNKQTKKLFQKTCLGSLFTSFTCNKRFDNEKTIFCHVGLFSVSS